MAFTPRTPAQSLAAWLPPMWQHLTQLPAEICQALVPLAIANQGSGVDAIQANLKLTTLAQMSEAEVLAAYAQANLPAVSN